MRNSRNDSRLVHRAISIVIMGLGFLGALISWGRMEIGWTDCMILVIQEARLKVFLGGLCLGRDENLK